MQIFLVTSCTNSKKLRPELDMTIASYCCNTDINEIAKKWVKNTYSKNNRILAAQLYKGQGWANAMSALKNLYEFANAELLISSAGYGLISHKESIASYACTFNKNSQDSIYRFSSQSNCDKAQIWWNIVHSSKEYEPNSYFIISLPHAYIYAMRDTIQELIVRHGDRVVILSYGDKNILFKNNTINFCSKINILMPGVMSSIYQRALNWITYSMAKYKLEISVSGLQDFIDREFKKLEQYKTVQIGKKITDEEIKNLIINMTINSAVKSATTGLKSIRTMGYACSQERFRKLFNDIRGQNA